MSAWVRLKRILSLSCAEAAELSSRRMDEPLAWTDKLAWAGHLLVCGSCRRFRRQLALLRDAARRVGSSVDESIEAGDGLSAERRMRIAQVMRDSAADK